MARRRKAKKTARKLLRSLRELPIRVWAWFVLTAKEVALGVVRFFRKRVGALWGWLDDIEYGMGEPWDED